MWFSRLFRTSFNVLVVLIGAKTEMIGVPAK